MRKATCGECGFEESGICSLAGEIDRTELGCNAWKAKEEDLKKICSVRIREIVKENSVASVAKSIGISRPSLYKYMSGTTAMSSVKLCELARFAGKPLEWFFTLEEDVEVVD